MNFIATAFAQDGGAAAAGGGLMGFVPLILIFVVFYFLLIRPQQKRLKQHRDMVAAVRRGDVVVTAGGLIGKVAKVEETEVQIDIADNVRIRVVKSTLAEVRARTEPAND